MPESSSHANLVRALVAWIAEEYLEGEEGAVLTDSSGVSSSGLPPRIGGYVPDAYAPLTSSGCCIIGEAKTAKDFENRHSLAQFEAFLDYCEHSPDSIFVLAVPWHSVCRARNVLLFLRRKNTLANTRSTVLENLTG